MQKARFLNHASPDSTRPASTTVTVARNEISPLLDAWVLQLEHEGSATQRAHFNRLRKRLAVAHDELELTTNIIELSSCTAMGFRFSNTADALVHRILEKAAELAAVLGSDSPQVH